MRTRGLSNGEACKAGGAEWQDGELRGRRVAEEAGQLGDFASEQGCGREAGRPGASGSRHLCPGRAASSAVPCVPATNLPMLLAPSACRGGAFLFSFNVPSGYPHDPPKVSRAGVAPCAWAVQAALLWVVAALLWVVCAACASTPLPCVYLGCSVLHPAPTAAHPVSHPSTVRPPLSLTFCPLRCPAPLSCPRSSASPRCTTPT